MAILIDDSTIVHVDQLPNGTLYVLPSFLTIIRYKARSGRLYTMYGESASEDETRELIGSIHRTRAIPCHVTEEHARIVDEALRQIHENTDSPTQRRLGITGNQ